MPGANRSCSISEGVELHLIIKCCCARDYNTEIRQQVVHMSDAIGLQVKSSEGVTSKFLISGRARFIAFCKNEWQVLVFRRLH